MSGEEFVVSGKRVMRSQNIQGTGRHITVYLDQIFNLEVGVKLEVLFGGHG